VPGRELPDARWQLTPADVADLQTETAQQPAYGLLEVDDLDLQLLACAEQRPDLLRGNRLAMNRPIPSMRSSWAIPRASRRSVLTAIADSAALTYRVYSSTGPNPASCSPS
jgi:hypothetical protein